MAIGFLEMQAITAVARKHGWKLVNPHSFLNAFDEWWQWELRQRGLAEFDPDDYPLH